MTNTSDTNDAVAETTAPSETDPGATKTANAKRTARKAARSSSSSSKSDAKTKSTDKSERATKRAARKAANAGGGTSSGAGKTKSSTPNARAAKRAAAKAADAGSETTTGAAPGKTRSASAKARAAKRGAGKSGGKTSTGKSTPNKRAAKRNRAQALAAADASFAAGLEVRHAMWGPGGGEEQIEAASEFVLPMQEVVTRYCFGETWTREGLSRRDRSLITLGILVSQARPNELKVHVRGALANGVTKEEIGEVLRHAMVYCGIPRGVEAFRSAAEVLRELGLD